MKQYLKKMKENILVCDFLFIGISLLLNYILYLMNIRFRQWMIITMILIAVIGFVVGILQQIYGSTKNKSKAIIISVLSVIFIIIIILICMPFITFFLIFSYHPEHTVMLDGKKYVAVVRSFLHANINYYDYYGPLLMGTKVRVNGDFGEGGYDPFVQPDCIEQVEYTYYDDHGKIEDKKTKIFKKEEEEPVIDKPKKEIEQSDEFNETKNNILPENAEVLYEKKFHKTIVRFSKVDNVLGQNILVHVVKSKDGGETFYVVSDNPIQVSNQAKFGFLTETLGFAISTGNISLNNGNSGLFITNDGDKTFTIANIEYENPNVDYITIQKEPYRENNLLKMKCSVYQLSSSRNGYKD